MMFCANLNVSYVIGACKGTSLNMKKNHKIYEVIILRSLSFVQNYTQQKAEKIQLIPSSTVILRFNVAQG